MRIRGLLMGVAVGALLVGAAQSGYAQTGNTGKALEGTWVLDTSKSDFGKIPAPKSETLWIMKATPTVEKWKVKRVNADGTTVEESYTGAVDEKFYAMPGDPDGATFAFMKDGGWAVKGKDGKVVENGTSATVSDGGKTLTLKSVSHGPDGDVNLTSVYTKSK